MEEWASIFKKLSIYIIERYHWKFNIVIRLALAVLSVYPYIFQILSTSFPNSTQQTPFYRIAINGKLRNSHSVHKTKWWLQQLLEATHGQDYSHAWTATGIQRAHQSLTHPLPEPQLLPLQLRVHVHRLQSPPSRQIRAAPTWSNLLPPAALHVSVAAYAPGLVLASHKS